MQGLETRVWVVFFLLLLVLCVFFSFAHLWQMHSGWLSGFQLGVPASVPMVLGIILRGSWKGSIPLPAKKSTRGLCSGGWHPPFCLFTRSPSLLLPALGLPPPHHTTPVNGTSLCPQPCLLGWPLDFTWPHLAFTEPGPTQGKHC